MHLYCLNFSCEPFWILDFQGCCNRQCSDFPVPADGINPSRVTGTVLWWHQPLPGDCDSAVHTRMTFDLDFSLHLFRKCLCERKIRKHSFNFASDMISSELQKEYLKWIWISVLLKVSKFKYAAGSKSKSLVFLDLET